MSALSDMVGRGLQTIMTLDSQTLKVRGVTVAGSYVPLPGRVTDFPKMSGSQGGWRVTIPLANVAELVEGDPVEIGGKYFVARNVAADSVAWEFTAE